MAQKRKSKATKNLPRADPIGAKPSLWSLDGPYRALQLELVIVSPYTSFTMFWKWLLSMQMLRKLERLVTLLPITNYGVFCIEKMLFYNLTFHIMGLPNFWRKKNLTFLGGTPPSGPLKIQQFQSHLEKMARLSRFLYTEGKIWKFLKN